VNRILLVVGLVAAGFFGLAAEPTPQEAVAQSVLFSPAPRFQVACRLTVVDPTGDTKVRELLVSTLRTGGEDRFLAQITAPAYLKELKFLRVQTKEGTGTWLKTSRGVQRLAPSADPEPLFGSDFTTVDFQPGAQNWEASPDGSLDQTVVTRSSEPRWGWVRQRLTIRSSDHLVIKSEFFDAAGGVVRRYEVTEFGPEGLPHRVVLSDLRNNRHSELEMLSMDTSKPGSGAVFAPGTL
jgi:hypothetical protein